MIPARFIELIGMTRKLGGVEPEFFNLVAHVELDDADEEIPHFSKIVILTQGEYDEMRGASG